MQKTMPTGQDTYVLSLPQGYEVGFYKLEDTGDMQNGATPNRLIPSNKAYLPGSSLPQKQHRPTDLLSLWMKNRRRNNRYRRRNRDRPFQESSSTCKVAV